MKLSVIIPAYNAVDFISKCLNSILKQSFKDFEVILVDDGSIDGTGQICDKYAENDSRIKVIHQNNCGIGTARNIGLDRASGEWIMFIDADDYVEENLFSILSDENLECSMIVFPPKILNANGKQVTEKFKDQYLSRDELIEYFAYDPCSSIFKNCWSKIIKKSIIRDQRFDVSIKIGEDHLFMLNLLGKIGSTRMMSGPSYVYRQSEINRKYQQTVSESINIMKKIFSSYLDIGKESKTFEIDLFCTYRALCQDEIYRKPSSWYNDSFIRKLFFNIKNGLTLSYRLRYVMSSFPLANRLIIKKHQICTKISK